MKTPLPRLAKTDFPIWHFPLTRPHTGPMLGNGAVGALAWGSGRVLELTISFNDLWDHEGGAEWREGQSYSAIRAALEANDEAEIKRIFPPTEKTPQLLPFGRIRFTLPEGLELDAAALDTHSGFLQIRTIGKCGRLRDPSFKIVLDRESGAIALELPNGFEFAAIQPVPAWEHEKVRSSLLERGYSAPLVEADGFAQPLPSDPAAAIAVLVKPRSVFAVAARGGDPKSITSAMRALNAARAKVAEVAALGAEALFERTAAHWAEYWKATPEIDVPNPVLQQAWEFGLYKFGAATDDRLEIAPAPLQGPWYEDYQLPPWGGDYHFNINIQEYYWPALQGNHLSRLRPLFVKLLSWMPRLRHNAKVFVGIDDGAMLSHATDDTGKAMSASFWTGMMDHGSTMWMAGLLWQYIHHGGDRALLKKGGFEFMTGAFNVFWKMLDHAPDGSLALPVSTSPEFRGSSMNAWGRNASFQLAAAHRLAENLAEAAALLRKEPDPRWREVSEKLPRAALVPVGGTEHIGLWEGLDLPETHRHHSHLAALFPFDSIDCTSPEWRDRVDQSFRNWMWRGTALWTGWCTPWASILHTRVGNSEMAELLLEIWDRAFTNEGRGTLHDTCIAGFSLFGVGGVSETAPYHPEREVMQLDAGLGAAAAVMQMLLHERRGVNYLFRGAPPRWNDVSFGRLLAPGGVLVSARRTAGIVGEVTLQGGVSPALFRLANPWGENAAFEVVRAEKVTVKKPAAVIEVRIKAGETLTLRVVQPVKQEKE